MTKIHTGLCYPYGFMKNLQATLCKSVLGPLDPKEMGWTLPHEHLSADLGCLFVPPTKREQVGAEVLPWKMENLGYIRDFP